MNTHIHTTSCCDKIIRMGKYMKKPKLTTTSALSETTLGVRTRAKTLHLRETRAEASRVQQGNSEPRNHNIKKETIGLCSSSSGSIGYKYLECESMGRVSRESTPCSFIMDVETTITPGSSTRGLISSAPNQRQQNAIPTNTPSKHDIDEFFAFTELQQELLFIERYNFDIKNDIPLSGRYEWVKVDQ